MDDRDLGFWSLPEATAAALPELRSDIRATVAWYIDLGGKPPYPHHILEEHLLPFVTQADQDGNEDGLRRAFEFLERIASHPDEDLVGALRHAFLEHLDPALLARHAGLVGQQLRVLFADWRPATPDEN